jgi:acyl-CoA thioester hydrolase
VRYSDVDNQGVVYNSRYLEFVDHAVTMWLRSRGLIYEELRHETWDFALRHADVEWLSPGRADEVLDVGVALEKLGTTSFTVLSEVTRTGEPPTGKPPIFRARVTYVTLDPATQASAPLPAFVRSALASEP